MATRTTPEPLQEILDTFEMLPDWEDRYRLIIDLGKKLPPLDPEQKTEANRVTGCQSNVWLVAESEAPKAGDSRDDGPVMRFVAESDSHIVRGLIAIVRSAYSDQPARHVIDFDLEGVLAEYELEKHITQGRRNGLESMIRRIKSHAARVLQSVAG